MQLYELHRDDIRKRGNVKNTIAAGEYIIRTDDFIRSAFNFGNGTRKDMNRYMKDNSVFCVWYEVETMRKVTKI